MSELTEDQVINLVKTLARKGGAYTTFSDNTHYNETIDTSAYRPAGNSRRSGDASTEVQLAAIQAIISAGHTAGLSDHDIAYVLLICTEN